MHFKRRAERWRTLRPFAQLPLPVKILHVVFTLEVGGMENGLINVARRLNPGNYSVHVCCLERSGPFAARLPDPGNVVVLGKPPGVSFGTMWRLSRLIRRLRPQLLHTHGFGPLLYATFATAMGVTCPILHGEHGMMYPNEQRPLHRLVRRWLYRCCRRVHTVSPGLKTHFVQHGFPASRLEVVINGVDSGRFVPGSKEAARKQIGLQAKGPVVGIVGSYSARKRHGLLFQAFDRLAQEMPDATLLVVGGGGKHVPQVLQQARESRVAAQIHLVGIQANTVPYYQAMDLLAVPSNNEGLSNSALEAMSCGVPALTHDACGNADVIDNNVDGIVCRIETVEELHRQLKLLLSDSPKLESLGRNAREKVLTRFSMDNMVREYERLYQAVLSNAPTG